MQQIIKVLGQTVKVLGIIVIVAAVILFIADIIFDLNLGRHTGKIVLLIGCVLYGIGNRDWNLSKKRK